MDSSLPQPADLPAHDPLLHKGDRDLLGDLDDFTAPPRAEPFRKPDTPEPEPALMKTDLFDPLSAPHKSEPILQSDLPNRQTADSKVVDSALSDVHKSEIHDYKDEVKSENHRKPDDKSFLEDLVKPEAQTKLEDMPKADEKTKIIDEPKLEDKFDDFIKPQEQSKQEELPKKDEHSISEDQPKHEPTPEPSASFEEPAFEAEVHADPMKVEEPFGFNKPLPPEPIQAVSDFLKSETTNGGSHLLDDKDDDISEFVGARGDPSPSFSREESPIPPPVPKHQNLRDDSPDRFESSPEPDFRPMDSGKDLPEVEPVPIKPLPPKPEEPKQNTPPTVKEAPVVKKPAVGVIGAKDIIVEINAWFNPARLHPEVESLVYWRDPKKSGVVFGVLMVTLLSLTTFSLISVVAYLGLIALAGTISFRVYKNIMQAVQKTSDGHPFKELLQLEIALPEDKVAEVSRVAAQHINTAISALRSLFLVEDLVDSIKGLVLFWALTYIGAIFNGLTLLIIGVVLLFSLPRLYEQNKDQVDAYIQIAMDKLSIVTNRMKAAIPSGKKEEKPKDQ